MNSNEEITFETVGKRMRHIRDAKKIKQIDVCNALGVAKASIIRIEQGKGASMDVFFAYLNYFKNVHNIFIPDLFDDNWSIDAIISENANNQNVNLNIDSNQKISSYSTQIKNILMVQRDKSYSEYNDLIDLAAKIERIHST